jgi:pantoate kinase
MKVSRQVYVPSGVSSFFEICDQTSDGQPIQDPLQIGARGGGFIISRGTETVAELTQSIDDEVLINGEVVPEAQTSLEVIRLIRKEFEIPRVRISHVIHAPIGQGFGTSGAGALATSIAVSDLFGLNFSLVKASDFAHISEIKNLTGLGTVISLASGGGAMGVVTEPGSYSIGRTDSILADPDDFTLVCAVFGPIKKSTILKDPDSRKRINNFGRETLNKILDDPTPERLLRESRIFSEKTGLASPELLKLSDRAVQSGAIGATPNMIGNALHSLVDKKKYDSFLHSFSGYVPKESIFESALIQTGPRISNPDRHKV